MMHFSFKDDGYSRPIVCSAFPGKQPLAATVVGRTWQPFAEATHPSSLAYLECEMTLFDHADSLQEPEALQFVTGGGKKGFVDISPGHSLYLVGEKNTSLTYEQFSFGHLKT